MEASLCTAQESLWGATASPSAGASNEAKPNFEAIPVPDGMQKSPRSPFIPPPGPACERVALPRGNKEKAETWQPEEEVWQTLQQSQAPEEFVCMVLGCVCMCARLWIRRSEYQAGHKVVSNAQGLSSSLPSDFPPRAAPGSQEEPNSVGRLLPR